MRTIGVWIFVPCLLFGLLVGCQNTAPTQGADVPLPAVDLSTPESAAKSLLLTLHAQIAAGARRDQAGIDAAVDQLATKIAAADKIIGRLSSRSISLASRTKTVNLVTRSWARLVSHYAAEFALDDIRRGSTQPDQVTVLVHARGAEDSAWLKIDCTNVENEWRVSRIDFLQGAPASQPATTRPP